MLDINSMIRENVLAQNRDNSLPCIAQLGIPENDCAIKGLVVSISWDCVPLDLFNGIALRCYLPS